MTAAPVRVDRPAERDLRRLGDAVERRLRADLVEAGLERLRRVEAADGRVVAIARQARLLVGGDGEVAPAHEHMFAYAADGIHRIPAVPTIVPATAADLDDVLPLFAGYQTFYAGVAQDDAKNRAFLMRFAGAGGAGR